MITHRVLTLMTCDKIIFLENGNVIDEGNYDYLLKNKQTLIKKK